MTCFSRMMFALALWALACAGPAHAITLDEAEQAVNGGRAGAVIAELERFVPRNETETLRRLWILGVAANRAGRPEAAVAPLARLVAEVPANPIFRLELARALIATGQSARALYHLELAKGAGLPPEPQAWAEAQIARLERPKTWQGYFRFALTPETNAAERTSASSVSLGGMVFNLAPEARAQSATGVELGFGLAALPVISDRARLRFGADVQAELFDGGAPDDVTLRANTALLHYGPHGRVVTAELFAARRWLDGAQFTRSHGVGLSFARALGARSRVTLATQFERLDYLQGGYSVDRTAASVALSHAATGQLVLRAAARLESRSSSFTPAGGMAAGVTIGGDYSFAGGLRMGVDLSYDHDTHDGRHPLFGVQRIDEKTGAALRLSHQDWSYRGFAPVLKLELERQGSTVILNRYRNLAASIGITRSF